MTTAPHEEQTHSTDLLIKQIHPYKGISHGYKHIGAVLLLYIFWAQQIFQADDSVGTTNIFSILIRMECNIASIQAVLNRDVSLKQVLLKRKGTQCVLNSGRPNKSHRFFITLMAFVNLKDYKMQ